MTSEVRVLVVDDDPLVREALAMMLDGLEGIRVVGSVGDGAEVPETLSRHATDVVLMDLRMPRVDGATATARLRERPGAPEVLVLTTFDADTEVLGALRAGACSRTPHHSASVRRSGRRRPASRSSPPRSPGG